MALMVSDLGVGNGYDSRKDKAGVLWHLMRKAESPRNDGTAQGT